MDVLLGMLCRVRGGQFSQGELPLRDRAVDRTGLALVLMKSEAQKMVLSFFWVMTLLAPLIALMLSTGCAPLSRQVTEARFVTTSPNATSAEPIADASGQYWKRGQSREIKLGAPGIVSIIERAGLPDEELTAGRRVAITEFNLEFVDFQLENPFGHPAMIGSRSGLTAALEPDTQPKGAGTKLAPLSTEDQIRTAQVLHDLFEQNLREAGMIIVPQAAVTDSAGYRNLKPRPSASSSWATLLSPASTETGVVFRTHTVAAPGLGVATCADTALAAAETEIMRETGADVVMAVRLRVGTYYKRAALEPNSAIRWTTTQGSINLTAQKAIVSDAEVSDASRFLPITGQHEPIDLEQYVHQLERMLPMFIGLALPTLHGRVSHSDPFARVPSVRSR